MQIYDFEVTDSSFEEKIKEAGFDVELMLPEINSKNFSSHVIGKKKGYVWRPNKPITSDDALKSINGLAHDDMIARAATAEELVSFEIDHKELIDGTRTVALGERAFIADPGLEAVVIREGKGEGKTITPYPWNVMWHEGVEFLVVFE
ncbi:MAG: hypothetical protein RJB39_16 [Candidatus Parcubacteria bacterium]|jgi:hypothetical protein